MKNIDKHAFDEIFRTGLIAPDQSEVDEDWALMKARLENGDNRGKIPYFFYLIASVAAVLLLVFSVMFSSDETSQGQGNLKNDTKKPGESSTLGTESNNIEPDRVANNLRYQPLEVDPDELDYPISAFPVIETLEAPKDASKPDLIKNESENLTDTSVNESILTAAIDPVKDENLNLVQKEIPVQNNELIKSNTDSPESDEDDTMDRNLAAKSRFSLAINFAPDMNGVEQFQSNKLSYSVGAGLIYKISNKLSVEAAAAYGRKIYQTGFSSFRPASYSLFQVKPNIVSSGFDVMDIQLNLAYTLLKKGKSSFGIGAGVSSYLMLDEKYSFTYQNIHARGLSSFSTGYQNNHFFGIANLNLSYKRNLTNNVKLAFNPYLKLPLTDLGYGNIRLRSAGMSVGVITNLNKAKK